MIKKQSERGISSEKAEKMKAGYRPGYIEKKVPV
jgi:hypothetical protein